MRLTPEDLKQIGHLLDEKLEGVHKRLDGVEQQLGRLGEAVVFLANC